MRNTAKSTSDGSAHHSTRRWTMGKDWFKVIFIGVVGAILVGGAIYLEERDVSDGKPKASYLTDEEAAQRPAYSQLSEKEQAVYEALYRGITEKKEFIPLPFEIDGDTYSKIYCTLEKQEGRFFYLGSSYYTAQKVKEAQIAYRDDLELADSKIAEFDEAEQRALARFKTAISEYEKVERINEYLVQNCTYVTGMNEEYSSTAYGCLVEKKANCEGYAKAFSILAADVGLESILITGITDKGENHAWNQVKVDDDRYNIDVTWADNDYGDEVRHAYFLCNDNDFSSTHIADRKLIRPYTCTADKENYYIKNGLYIRSEEDARKLIEKEIINGEKSIEMKFAGKSLYEDFKKKYIDEQYIFEVMEESGREFNSTMTVSVKEGDGDNCMTLELG